MDVGELGTQIVEMYQGYTFNQGSLRSNIGGQSVTQYLMEKYSLDRENAKYLKEVSILQFFTYIKAMRPNQTSQ